MYKPSSSIFNKAFREQFNQNKYMNLTALPDKRSTAYEIISKRDYNLGRVMFYLLTISVGAFVYYDPSYLHETLGHLPQPAKHLINLGRGLDPEEFRLNQLQMERHTAEHKLIHFKESIKGFDGK